MEYTTLSSMLVATILSMIFTLSAKQLIPKWKEREFNVEDALWKKASIFATVSSVAIAGISSLFIQFLFVIIPIAIITWTFGFSSFIDLKIAKAPREVAWFGHIATLPFLVWGLASQEIVTAQQIAFFPEPLKASLFNLVAWFIMITAITFISGRGLGMADSRLLYGAGLAVGWWVGFQNMLVLFGVAAVLQILAFIPAKKLNWGVPVETKSGVKRAIPFIPAISVAFTIGSVVLLAFAR